MSVIGRNGIRWLVRGVKLTIVLLVLWGISSSIAQARRDLQQQPIDWTAIQWSWLAASAGFYGVGMLPMGVYWYYLLRRMGQAPAPYDTLRAFYIGHLGKYVPGKVMVVLLRTGFIRSQHVDTTLAAVSVFMETLTMMASGAFLAAGLLLFVFQAPWPVRALSVGLLVVTLSVTCPPILRKTVTWLKSTESPERLEEMTRHLRWPTMIVGWCAALCCWLLLTLSLWAVLQSLPFSVEARLTVAAFSRWLGSVTLAVVAGFLSLLPGGLLVREWALNQLMVPHYGATVAVVSALLLRAVWLVTEVAISLILYAIPPRASNRQPVSRPT